MNKNKIILLTSCLGVCSIAIALVVTANRIDRGALGYSLDPNATSKVLVLDLSKEHTFVGNTATEYALNENAGNFGVEFSLVSLSTAEDSMAVINNKTRLRANDAIFNAVPLSGVTKITVNGGNGNFHLFGGYSNSSMYEFLEEESNGGSRTFNNIPGLNYFRFEGKYDNYDCDISSIEFTYSAVGHECRYGEETPLTDIVTKNGIYKKYVGDSVQHKAEINSNKLLFDDVEYVYTNIVYQDKYLYSYDRNVNLFVSYSGNDLIIEDVNDRYSNKNGTYVIGQEATAVTMFVDGNEVAENSAASRMNVAFGSSFTFSATSNAVPAETVTVEFVDETGTAPVPGVGTYTPKSTITVTDVYGTWAGGEQFELSVNPIVVTKESGTYYAQYSDAGYGEYAGTSGTFEGSLNSSNGKLSFASTDGKLSFDIDTNTNELDWTYVDEEALVYATGNVNCDFASEGGATATFENGVVTVLEAGDFHLTATAGNGVSATLYVHVNAYVPAVVSFTESSKALVIGETYQINATVNNDATNKTLTYTSSKPSVAIVSNKGLVTAKAEGSTTITISTVDGSVAVLAVTVSKPVSSEVTYTFVDDGEQEVTATVVSGQTVTLNLYGDKYVFQYDSTDELYHFTENADITVSIRNAGGTVYLDYVDANQELFGYVIYLYGDSVELTLA